MIFFFSEKISLDISCESFAWQTIDMKYQDFFLQKIKKKEYFKILSAAVVIGALMVDKNINK